MEVEVQAAEPPAEAAAVAEAGDTDGAAVGPTWIEMEFGESTPPQLLYRAQEVWNPAPSSTANLPKGVRWSPDGACLLAACESNFLCVFDLPSDCLERPPEEHQEDRDAELMQTDMPGMEGNAGDSLQAALTVQEGGTVYDYCWHPTSAADASSCCFLTTTRAHPLHLWDALTGSLRASYRAYDQMDEITAAYSCAFSPSGDQLLCGYNRGLRLFDVARPGRDCMQIATWHKKRREGQSGIISSLDYNPDRSGLAAAGCYDRTAALYLPASRECLSVLHGHCGGVTQVKFSRDGNYLYTGARKDAQILCWDIRYTLSTIYTITRDTADTNQRMQFDIEPCGRHLITGGCDGSLHCYDLRDGAPVASFAQHPDTINGAAFHPHLNLAATASGHRTYHTRGDDPADTSSDEEEGEGGGAGAGARVPGGGSTAGCLPPQQAPPRRKQLPERRSSVCVWRCSYIWGGNKPEE